MSDQDPLEIDANTIEDPRERARILFIQWHVDEVTPADEAATYADRLLERLAEYGLEVRALARRPGRTRVEFLLALEDNRWETTIEDVPFETDDDHQFVLWAQEELLPQARFRKVVQCGVYSILDPGGDGDECQRCGTRLDGDGICQDITCPFSDHSQDCPKGWEGYPGRQVVGDCLCSLPATPEELPAQVCSVCGNPLTSDFNCLRCLNLVP